MDISETLKSKSTQLDNIDLIGGPQVFTIEAVKVVGGEQPLVVDLVEYDRPWKPGVTMRRILAKLWGTDSSKWVGRKVRLYRDEKVMFGRETPGGTRISHMSDIDKIHTLTLPTSQGRTGRFVIEPLADAPDIKPSAPSVTEADVMSAETVDVLRGLWGGASPALQSLIRERVDVLKDMESADPARDTNSPFEGDAS